MPLSIFYAHKPVRRLPPEARHPRAVSRPARDAVWPSPADEAMLSWTNFFLPSTGLEEVERPVSPFRRRAVRKAAAWMREHFEDSDGVGAIFPPMIYTVVALRCLGVPDDDPEIGWAMSNSTT